MPPARVLFADRNKMLRSIAETAARQREQTLERCAHYVDYHRDKVLEEATWVPRDLPRLAGRLLTPSERKVHQKELREMEADGLIEIYTVSVRLTDAGRKHVESLS